MLVFFVSLAYIFEMDTIKFLITRGMDVAMVAAVIVFQPELRRALEQLGEQKLLSNLMSFDSLKDIQERFSDKTVDELVKGTMAMARVKTGALIVIEKNTPLTEYERTGIQVDAIVTSQLLINIFEHNTPLHDGAVIVRGNRVTSATCYLPLSDNMELSKELGNQTPGRRGHQRSYRFHDDHRFRGDRKGIHRGKRPAVESRHGGGALAASDGDSG
mgnify:CR=1 FL=1